MESSPESHSASGSRFLTGAEQAGEMTASYKMQAYIDCASFLLLVSLWVTVKSYLGTIFVLLVK